MVNPLHAKDAIFCYKRWHLLHHKMACFAAKDAIFCITAQEDKDGR